MRIDKKKALTLFALTLLITVLLLVNMNGPTSATSPPARALQVGEASLGPIVLPDPTEIEIPYCETGDIAICVENFTGVVGFQFKIWWLKDVVNYTGYEWKPYPPGWSAAITAGPVFDENATHKAVQFGITSFPPSASSYAGRWPFIDIYWHCLEPGVDSPLIFDRDFTQLFDADSLPIPIGTIIDGLIINPALPPEDLELYPREVVDLEDPYIIGTQWHELHPSKRNFYNLTSWEPGKVLSPEDQIDMYAIDPPVKIYLENITAFDPMSPICSWWHETFPSFSQVWHLSSWEDNGDGMLSPCDQIDMTNNETGDVVWFHVQDIFEEGPGLWMLHLDVKYWFQVDDVTVDMTLSLLEVGPQIFVEYKCGYWTFDPKNPICTKWNEIDPELGPVRCLHLTSWIDDNGDGELSPCDIIDMTPMYPINGTVEYYHVDNMTISLKLTPEPSPPVVPPPPTFGPVYLDSMISYDEFDLANPVCTKWHEIYPVNSTIWHLSSWEDGPFLSPSDQIVLTLKDPETHEPIPGTEAEYHVDKLTVAMNMTSSVEPELWRIVKFEGSLKQFKVYHWTKPVSTQWHEVNPNYSRQWHLSSWEDTGEPFGELSHCDTIWMMDKKTGLTEVFHVNTLSTDMWVTKKPPPRPPQMYWKENYTDYAPSGMPDFDQRQDLWNTTWGFWSWCAPTAVANSLWWMDSRYENSTTPPPTINDTFPLVSPYGPWDDHDPNNTMPLISHLAYLMDTDGQRTGLPHVGTWVWDMQAGIAQYLSWTGLNPQGDCNGDGVADNADQTIINNAWMKSPGQLGWDMRADIFPSTVGWPVPGMADNIVDINDLNLWLMFNGSAGMFYEQTVPAPDFYLVEEEVEKCEDVVLVLGFYIWTGIEWIREEYPYEYESGHCVTVAGVNSTTLQIAISDPIQDNAEPPPQGTNGPGRVLPPPPHPHGLGPTYPLHNNATYVSQDIYNVTWAPPLPFPANFTLANYSSPQFPGMLAAVEWAVIVSPLVRDVAVTSVTPSLPQSYLDTAYPTWDQSKPPILTVDVTVKNNGTQTETFTVTLYFDSKVMGTKTVTLDAGKNKTETFTFDIPSIPFAWPYPTYTISANASVVLGETNTTNNHLSDGTIHVMWPGDMSDDGYVELDDLDILADHWDPSQAHPAWYDVIADMNLDGVIELDDLDILADNWMSGPLD